MLGRCKPSEFLFKPFSYLFSPSDFCLLYIMYKMEDLSQIIYYLGKCIFLFILINVLFEKLQIENATTNHLIPSNKLDAYFSSLSLSFTPIFSRNSTAKDGKVDFCFGGYLRHLKLKSMQRIINNFAFGLFFKKLADDRF